MKDNQTFIAIQTVVPSIAKILRTTVSSPGIHQPRISHLMTARALVELGVAAFGCRELRRVGGKPETGKVGFKISSEDVILFLSPNADGALVFDLAVSYDDRVAFHITPEDFDLGREEDSLRLHAYRGLAELARLLPPPDEASEGMHQIGPFTLLCDPVEDKPNWEKVWARWEKAGSA
jgi:hypothetical protein